MRSATATADAIGRRAFPTMGTVASLAVRTPAVVGHEEATAAAAAAAAAVAAVAQVLCTADRQFSPYRHTSELQRLRRGGVLPMRTTSPNGWAAAPGPALEQRRGQMSASMRKVLAQCERLERSTGGAFTPFDSLGRFDPTGLVKGWAMERAVRAVNALGYADVCLNVGGDVRTSGLAHVARPWRVALVDPLRKGAVRQVVAAPASGEAFAVATSGTQERGEHLWDQGGRPLPESRIAVTVVGADAGVVDAIATAVWVRARVEGVQAGLDLLQRTAGCEGCISCTAGCLHRSEGFPQHLVSSEQPTVTLK